MADNVAITAGTGTSVATDDIGGVQYQRVKATWGPDGTANDTDVASGKPMPVQLRTPTGTAGSFGAGITDSGTVRVVNASDSVIAAVAHDAVDSGEPTKIGARATTSLSGLTLVSNADRTDILAGVDGVILTRPHSNLEDLLTPVPVGITDGSSTSIMASAGAGVKNYVTTCIIANTSATAVTVNLRDGAAGTVKATFPVPASTSGVVCNFPVPLGFSAATAVCAHPSAAASTITVTLLGFKSKV
jgi:hypothetical protein